MRAHGLLGWDKVVPAPSLGIPKAHQWRAKILGYIIIGFVGLCYLSFPIYTHNCAPSAGAFNAI